MALDSLLLEVSTALPAMLQGQGNRESSLESQDWKNWSLLLILSSLLKGGGKREIHRQKTLFKIKYYLISL